MSESIKDAFYRGRRETDREVRRLMAEAGYHNAELFDMSTVDVVKFLLNLLTPKN